MVRGVIWRAHSSKTTWLSRATRVGWASKPGGGYDKKNQAADAVGVMDAPGVRTAELVTHDIGIMVDFALAATQSPKMRRLAISCFASQRGHGRWPQYPMSGPISRHQ